MKQLLNVEQTAERLGTSERHVRELVYRRALPYCKVGRLVRIDPDDLDAWIDSHRVSAKAAV
jgi:excisionase family DNA binding protein